MRKRFGHGINGNTGKLVRDNVLNEVAKHHPEATVNYRFLEKDELKIELLKKFQEESNELLSAINREGFILEIIDILDVIEAMKVANEISEAEIEDLRKIKTARMGLFSTGLYISWVELEKGRLYDYYLKDLKNYPELDIKN